MGEPGGTTVSYQPAPGYPPPPAGYAPPQPPKRKRRGRRILLALVGVVVVIVVIVAIAGGSGKTKTASSVSTTAVTPAASTGAASADSSDSASSSASSAPSVAAKGQAAHVGSAIALKGENSGDQLTVTLVAVDPRCTATDGFSTPPSGDSYYCVQWRLTDTGSTAYEDAPSNGTVVIDGAGQQYQTDLVSSVSSGPELPTDTKIAPGSSALGWIVYDVATGATVTQAQFSLASGFGDTGQWAVP